MFWGLIMEPQRRYSQVVKKPFHISMAALDESTSDTTSTQVMCSFDDRNYLLCTLQKGRVTQVALDLNYEIGDRISFATNGKSHVHLTGYLIKDEYLDDIEEEAEEEEAGEDHMNVELVDEVSTKYKRPKRELSNIPPKKKSKTLELLEAVKSEDDTDSDDSDVNMSDLMDEDVDTTGIEEEEVDDEEVDDGEDEIGEEGSDDEDDIEDEDFDEDSSSMSEDEEIQKPQKVVENGVAANKRQRKSSAKQQEEKPQPQSPEKRKREKPGDKTPAKGDKTPVKGDKTPAKGDKTPKASKGDNSPKTEKTPGKTPKQAVSPQKISPQKRTVEGGVVIEDLKVGNGQVAKSGKFVRVYYEGKFKANNKIFDATTKGPGFEFRLGDKEVIRGWDVGLSGMKVGGKRRIVCPPNMAYGPKGSPPTIPPNSTLVFEIELKHVK